MIDRRTVMTAALPRFAGMARTHWSAGRHEPDHRLRVFVRRLGGRRYQACRICRPPLLIVNTASLCGFTPQYAGLQELWTEFMAAA